MMFLITTALARPGVSVGLEGSFGSNTANANTHELGGGVRLGVHQDWFSVEVLGTGLSSFTHSADWHLGYDVGRYRQGELSALALAGLDGAIGFKGLPAEVRVGADIGLGNGLRLERTCSYLDGVGAACGQNVPRTHLLASVGPRLAIGPVWLYARAEPHLASVQRLMGSVSARKLALWTDVKLGMRVRL